MTIKNQPSFMPLHIINRMVVINGYIDTNLIIVLLALLTSAGCTGQIQTKPSEQDDTTMINQIKDGKKDGLWKAYYRNGQLKSEGSYTEGLKEGLHKEWQHNGILLLEGFYANGKANGLMKWFHEKGHLAGEGNMVDDARVGPWKICDIEENGFCIEAYFENDKREGIWKIHHKNSSDKLWKEQTFKNDKMVAEKCWDKNGKQIECK